MIGRGLIMQRWNDERWGERRKVRRSSRTCQFGI